MCARNHGGKERMERLTTNDIYKVDGVSREKGVLVGDGWDEADKQKKNKFQLYVRDCTPVFATSAPHPTTFGWMSLVAVIHFFPIISHFSSIVVPIPLSYLLRAYLYLLQPTTFRHYIVVFCLNMMCCCVYRRRATAPTAPATWPWRPPLSTTTSASRYRHLSPHSLAVSVLHLTQSYVARRFYCMQNNFLLCSFIHTFYSVLRIYASPGLWRSSPKYNILLLLGEKGSS